MNLAIKTTTLTREDWLKVRQSGIGGSDNLTHGSVLPTLSHCHQS